MNEDPICGMPMDPGDSIYTCEYRGETYYFCSSACREQFNFFPERYAAQKAA
jgi:YHS domain-containing protein